MVLQGGGTLWALTLAEAKRHEWAEEHSLPHSTAVCSRVVPSGPVTGKRFQT